MYSYSVFVAIALAAVVKAQGSLGNAQTSCNSSQSWIYEGCYAETIPHGGYSWQLLPNSVPYGYPGYTNSLNMTLDLCLTGCRGHGFKYILLDGDPVAGQSCWCSTGTVAANDTLTADSVASNNQSLSTCHISPASSNGCTGNRNEWCGSTTGSDLWLDPSFSNTSTASNAANYAYVGCYHNNNPGISYITATTPTSAQCLSYCGGLGWAYSFFLHPDGIASNCGCGSEIMSNFQTTETDCSVACNSTLSTTTYCGGTTTNVVANVYINTQLQGCFRVNIPGTTSGSTYTGTIAAYTTTTTTTTTSTSSSAPAAVPTIVYPNTITCPASNGSTYVDSTGKGYTVYCNVDSTHTGFNPTYLQSFGQCASLCDATCQCLGFTWAGNSAGTGNGTCYFKRGYVGNITSQATDVMAIRTEATACYPTSASALCSTTPLFYTACYTTTTITTATSVAASSAAAVATTSSTAAAASVVVASSSAAVVTTTSASASSSAAAVVDSSSATVVTTASASASSSAAATPAAPSAACPASNGTVFTDASGYNYTIRCSSDTSVSASSNAAVSGDFNSCFSLCDADTLCTSFVFLGTANGLGPGNCYLKHGSTAGTVVSSDSAHVAALRVVAASSTTASAAAVSTVTPTLSCPAANGIVYTDPSGYNYSIGCGNDTTMGAYSQTTVTTDFNSCFALCDSDSLCTAWVFAGAVNGTGPGSCYIKHGANAYTASDNFHVAALRVAAGAFLTTTTTTTAATSSSAAAVGSSTASSSAAAVGSSTASSSAAAVGSSTASSSAAAVGSSTTSSSASAVATSATSSSTAAVVASSASGNASVNYVTVTSTEQLSLPLQSQHNRLRL
ncbi:hypothetical protein LTR16_000533 [Cryomyces antarcticus]|uniref:WSC domain-containing protein n=1 Tax=Cryomyces antarcticus TaxID=329879 RepID=A0ABR0MBC1_9PEZI|nr:hypothetical protein LTR16_000533 [Cryomyces antarcticus]